MPMSDDNRGIGTPEHRAAASECLADLERLWIEDKNIRLDGLERRNISAAFRSGFICGMFYERFGITPTIEMMRDAIGLDER